MLNIFRMSPVSGLVCGLLLASAIWMGTGASARADTVEDKPRLAILLASNGKEFVALLKARLAETRRFQVVDAPNLRRELSRNKILLGSRLTVQQGRQLMGAAGVELIWEGSFKEDGEISRVTGRLYDLRTGEFTRDLSLMGASGTGEALADQLATYVRHSVPLRCQIKDVAEDKLILDLGEMDGVRKGSFYRVYRRALNVNPQPIGTVRVTEVQPFVAVAEVEEAPKGVQFQRGDILMEQTSGMLLEGPRAPEESP